MTSIYRCGSNFTKEHIVEIVALASKLKLPIIADEIYSDMVYGTTPPALFFCY